jgi:hypothetical protein
MLIWLVGGVEGVGVLGGLEGPASALDTRGIAFTAFLLGVGDAGCAGKDSN